MSKQSIRFYNDKEIRAVWDDGRNKWWFSILDIILVLNEYQDYDKARNYWKYLKRKLKKENSQLVSATTQLKLTASDGKKYNTDTVDSDGVINLAKSDYLHSMKLSVTDDTIISALLQNSLTDKIADREMFMKGVDYSYYYEEEVEHNE